MNSWVKEKDKDRVGDFLQCLPHHLAHSLSLNIRMWGNQELTIGVADAKNGVSLEKGFTQNLPTPLLSGSTLRFRVDKRALSGLFRAVVFLPLSRGPVLS